MRKKLYLIKTKEKNSTYTDCRTMIDLKQASGIIFQSEKIIEEKQEKQK